MGSGGDSWTESTFVLKVNQKDAWTDWMREFKAREEGSWIVRFTTCQTGIWRHHRRRWARIETGQA